MTPVLTRAEMRELDRRASEEGRVPSLLLMENAGRGAAELLLQEFPAARRVAVVCGSGNNGGDGFVVARRLLARGLDVKTLLAADPERLRGDALENHCALVDAGGTIVPAGASTLGAFEQVLGDADVIVDALFGTGLDREVGGLQRELIERVNAARARRIALDVPSGLDADTGVPLGAAVRAALTVTFGYGKRGLCTPLGAAHAGRVVVVDIGIPSDLAERVGYGAARLEPADVAAAIAPRTTLSHKGASGRVLVIAGSPGKIGAALLVARGALRAGAGLVTLAAVPSVAAVLDQRVLEAMTARIDAEAPEASLAPLLAQTDVVAIGPGLGLDADARRVAEHVVLGWPGLIVVDADAITLFKGRAAELSHAKGRLVLTPHPGELARLLGCSTPDIEADRFGAVERAASATAQTILLKGACTLIGAPAQRIAVNPAGHALLATGGAGDVLAGVLAALAVGSEPYRAACAAAYAHGLAAELLARERGVDRGVLASEVADAVPRAIGSLLGAA